MNVLTARQRERILERLRRGDSLRKIQAETGHRRETIARLGRRAGVMRGPFPAAAEANESLGPIVPPSRCEPFRGFIEERVGRGASARTIHRELVVIYGFDGAYNSVKRFVRKLRVPSAPPNAVASLCALRRNRNAWTGWRSILRAA